VDPEAFQPGGVLMAVADEYLCTTWLAWDHYVHLGDTESGIVAVISAIKLNLIPGTYTRTGRLYGKSNVVAIMIYVGLLPERVARCLSARLFTGTL